LLIHGQGEIHIGTVYVHTCYVSNAGPLLATLARIGVR